MRPRRHIMRTLSRLSGVTTYSKAVETMSDMKDALAYFNSDSMATDAIKELEVLLTPIQKIKIA